MVDDLSNVDVEVLKLELSSWGFESELGSDFVVLPLVFVAGKGLEQVEVSLAFFDNVLHDSVVDDSLLFLLKKHVFLLFEHLGLKNEFCCKDLFLLLFSNSVSVNISCLQICVDCF